jgi:hypothetical protein
MTPEEKNDSLWFRRFLFTIGGSALGFVAAWGFAFGFYGVPFTDTGVEGVIRSVVPAGIICGGIAGALLVYHLERRKRSK